MTNEEKPFMTIDVLAVHLDYVRDDLEKIIKGMQHMATTDDIQKLSARMDKFVSTDRFEALEKKVEQSSMGNSISRMALIVTRISAAIAAIIVLCGLVAGAVHYFDKIKAVI